MARALIGQGLRRVGRTVVPRTPSPNPAFPMPRPWLIPIPPGMLPRPKPTNLPPPPISWGIPQIGDPSTLFPPFGQPFSLKETAEDQVSDLNENVNEPSASIPYPIRKRGRWSAICKVVDQSDCPTASGKSVGFGYGYGASMTEARKAAEKMAKDALKRNLKQDISGLIVMKQNTFCVRHTVKVLVVK